MSIQDAETITQETPTTAKRRKSAAARKSPVRKSKARKTARRRPTVSRALPRPANRILRQGRRVVSRAYSLADEARRAVPRLTREVRLPRRKDLDILTHANPLVVGAIGLGIGVVLGSLMPHRSTSATASSSGRGRR